MNIARRKTHFYSENMILLENMNYDISVCRIGILRALTFTGRYILRLPLIVLITCYGG